MIPSIYLWKYAKCMEIDLKTMLTYDLWLNDLSAYKSLGSVMTSQAEFDGEAHKHIR